MSIIGSRALDGGVEDIVLVQVDADVLGVEEVEGVPPNSQCGWVEVEVGFG